MLSLPLQLLPLVLCQVHWQNYALLFFSYSHLLVEGLPTDLIAVYHLVNSELIDCFLHLFERGRLCELEYLLVGEGVEERGVPPFDGGDVSIEGECNFVPPLHNFGLDLVLLSEDVVELLDFLLDLLAMLHGLVGPFFQKLQAEDGPPHPLLAAAHDQIPIQEGLAEPLMELYPLLLGHEPHLHLLVLLLVDQQLSRPVLHEEEVALLVTHLPTLVNRHPLLLRRGLFLLHLLPLLQLFPCDSALCEQRLRLLLLLQLPLVDLLQLLNLRPECLAQGGLPFGLKGLLDLYTAESLPLIAPLLALTLQLGPHYFSQAHKVALYEIHFHLL